MLVKARYDPLIEQIDLSLLPLITYRLTCEVEMALVRHSLLEFQTLLTHFETNVGQMRTPFQAFFSTLAYVSAQ